MTRGATCFWIALVGRFTASDFGTGCRAHTFRPRHRARPLPCGGGISLWDPQEADSGLDGSWWLCGLAGQCGTSFALSLLLVRARGIEGDSDLRFSRPFVGAIALGGGYGRWLMGMYSGQGFSLCVWPTGPLLIASLLVSWGCRVDLFPSFLSLWDTFLDLSFGCSLWALGGPCCVLGAQEF